MKIIGIKKIPVKFFENGKGDLLKFVSKNDPFFKSFGEVYFNEIKYKKKKGWIKHLKNQCIFSVAFGEINFKLIDGRIKSKTFDKEENITLNKNKHSKLSFHSEHASMQGQDEGKRGRKRKLGKERKRGREEERKKRGEGW